MGRLIYSERERRLDWLKACLLIYLLLVVSVLFSSCAEAPKRIQETDLGAISVSVERAQNHLAKAGEELAAVQQKHLPSAQAEIKAQVDKANSQIQSLVKANDSLKAGNDKLKQALKESDARAWRMTTWAWYGSCLLFVVVYFLTKLLVSTASFAGWYGVVLNILTKFVPLPVLAGVGAVLAGGIILKFALQIWSWCGCLIKWFI